MPQSETQCLVQILFQCLLNPVQSMKLLIYIYTNNLNNSKGIVLDGFSVKVVKYVINDIAYPLCKIFNQSFLIGIFPDKLKHAKITPIAYLNLMINC